MCFSDRAGGSKIGRCLPDHGRPRQLRADAEPRRFAEHRAHDEPRPLHLRRRERDQVSGRRRYPGRCCADVAFLARPAAAERYDREDVDSWVSDREG